MTWTPYHHWMWFWCWLCFKAYMILPIAATHQSRYGRFSLWLLGYGGGYAHSTRADFHLCSWFYPSEAAQAAAWDRHTAQVTRHDGGTATDGAS